MSLEGSGIPKSKFFVKILIILISLTLSILACEILVRVAHLAPVVNRLKPGLSKSVYRFSDNPILGYVFKENYRDEDNPDMTNSYPFINSKGFRDIEREKNKKKGVKRVILLGDSVVAGANAINDHNKTISRQLEEMLKPQKVEVLNFGINGYCTRAEVELLIERGLSYNPDLVILLFVHNDYTNFNNDLGNVDINLNQAIKEMFIHSHLFRLLSIQFDFFEIRKKLGISDFAGKWLDTVDKKTMDKLRQSKSTDQETLKKHISSIGNSNVIEGLKILKKLSDEYAFKVMIGIWPVFTRNGILNAETAFDGKLKHFVSEREELMIEKIARREGIFTFRFSPYFTDNFNKIKNTNQRLSPLLYAPDQMHPNVNGAFLAAAALKRVILKNSVLLR